MMSRVGWVNRERSIADPGLGPPAHCATLLFMSSQVYGSCQPESVRAGPRVSWASSPAARRTMLANRRRDTGPELALRSSLHRSGERSRVDLPVPGLPRRRIDIAFPRRRVAVYVDGCFWHGCPEHHVAPEP